MRVLITGGAGFIGSHLADRLLHRGDEVVVIDNYSTGQRSNLPDAHPALTIHEGSVADRNVVDAALGCNIPDVIVHAAASYKNPDAWNEDAATNVTGTINVAGAAASAGVRRVIYFQTALCYGLHPAEQPIGLKLPLDPGASSYAISKTAAEHYLFLSELDVISFRLANAYGPRNLSGPLPTFFRRLTNDLPCSVVNTRRDFIYVQDLVDCVLLAVDGGGRRGPYHISSGSDFSIKELFDATVLAMGVTLTEPVSVSPRNPDDAPTILLDPSQTRADFGWCTSTPLSKGVEAAITYYRQHGIEQTFTHLKAFDEDS